MISLKISTVRRTSRYSVETPTSERLPFWSYTISSTSSSACKWPARGKAFGEQFGEQFREQFEEQFEEQFREQFGEQFRVSFEVSFGLADSFSGHWGQQADPCHFDWEGRLFATDAPAVWSRFLTQKLWDMLTPPASSEQEEARLRKQLASLFGPDFLVGALRNRPGRAVRFRSRNKEGLIWWKRIPGAGRSGP